MGMAHHHRVRPLLSVACLRRFGCHSKRRGRITRTLNLLRMHLIEHLRQITILLEEGPFSTPLLQLHHAFGVLVSWSAAILALTP